jgi:hypothetical protein
LLEKLLFAKKLFLFIFDHIIEKKEKEKKEKQITVI